eukprot:s1899_g3.t1
MSSLRQTLDRANNPPGLLKVKLREMEDCKFGLGVLWEVSNGSIWLDQKVLQFYKRLRKSVLGSVLGFGGKGKDKDGGKDSKGGGGGKGPIMSAERRAQLFGGDSPPRRSRSRRRAEPSFGFSQGQPVRRAVDAAVAVGGNEVVAGRAATAATRRRAGACPICRPLPYGACGQVTQAMWEGMHTQLPGTGAREDEYQLLRSIGSGSFGQVFLVLHKEEHREFVMKSIDLHSASDEGRQQMELEVQLLRTMQHPNIVAYRDSFIDRTGHLCILMEYCEHGDIFTYLQEVRRTNSAPEEGRLLEWFTHIVWALQSLHQQKILHRDLKTQNIFLTGHRQQNILAAKLGDFGIAKVLTSTADLAKTQIGTPFYMSPELINSHPYSYKSDVWGLGCVLYEVVNGHRAFDAQSLNGLALKIIKGSYTPISASCSGPTKQLIQSMLSKSPAHRPSLKEILHMPAIRSKIPAAYRSSIAAGSSEARHGPVQSIETCLSG